MTSCFIINKRKSTYHLSDNDYHTCGEHHLGKHFVGILLGNHVWTV